MAPANQPILPGKGITPPRGLTFSRETTAPLQSQSCLAPPLAPDFRLSVGQSGQAGGQSGGAGKR